MSAYVKLMLRLKQTQDVRSKLCWRTCFSLSPCPKPNNLYLYHSYHSVVHYTGETIPGLNRCYCKKNIPFLYQSFWVSPCFSSRAMPKPGFSTSVEVSTKLNNQEGWINIVCGDEAILSRGGAKVSLNAGINGWGSLVFIILKGQLDGHGNPSWF